MKDFFKVFATAVSIGATVYKAIRKAKNEKEKRDIYKAIAERDLDKLRELVFK